MSTSSITIEESLLSPYHSLPETDPLGGLRAGAVSAFGETGLPEKKTEAYKYTPVKRMLEKNFDFALAAGVAAWSKEECREKFYREEDANHLVFVNGRFMEDYSVIRSDSHDLEIRAIDDAVFHSAGAINENLGKIADGKNDAFAALNTASFTCGLFLKANKNTINKPVYVYQFVDAEQQAVFHPRVLLVAETGSEVRAYEKTFRKGSSNAFSNSIIEIKVAQNAEVRWSKLQHYTDRDYTVEGIYAVQDRDSRLFTNTVSFKGALIRNNLNISLNNENCETHMHGLYLVGGKTHIDNNTAVDHKMPNSFSNELYKGIIDENARAVFNGKIYVRPQAQKTNAFQSNNNILLSETATVNTKPQLEIWADDVKCSHGCTTGQLDEEAIFYLQSRGISKTKAKALLLNAFASEALQEIKSNVLKEEIEENILNKLGS